MQCRPFLCFSLSLSLTELINFTLVRVKISLSESSLINFTHTFKDSNSIGIIESVIGSENKAIKSDKKGNLSTY